MLVFGAAENQLTSLLTHCTCLTIRRPTERKFPAIVIGKLHPHMLRHTYLTRLYNVEKDLRFVQDQAGHASPTTTAIYVKTNNTARKGQVEALDEEES